MMSGRCLRGSRTWASRKSSPNAGSNSARDEPGEEVDVAGEPVELGDHQGGAGAPGVGDGLGQLGAVGPLAALDLAVGGEDHGVVGPGEVVDGGDLGIEA